MKANTQITLLLMLLLNCGVAQAYIGPGAGLSVLGSVFALIGGLLLLVIGFLWYPIKRFIKRNKE